MDNTLLVALIGASAGIVGGVVGALGTYATAFQKFRQDLKSFYDKDVRDKRITAYRELWELTRNFPAEGFDRVNPLTYRELHDLMKKMHDWYFNGDGMYLGNESTSAYFDFKYALQDVIRSGKLDDDFDGSEKDNELRNKAHELRRRQAKDIGTRVKLLSEYLKLSK